LLVGAGVLQVLGLTVTSERGFDVRCPHPLAYLTSGSPGNATDEVRLEHFGVTQICEDGGRARGLAIVGLAAAGLLSLVTGVFDRDPTDAEPDRSREEPPEPPADTA